MKSGVLSVLTITLSTCGCKDPYALPGGNAVSFNPVGSNDYTTILIKTDYA